MAPIPSFDWTCIDIEINNLAKGKFCVLDLQPYHN